MHHGDGGTQVTWGRICQVKLEVWDLGLANRVGEKQTEIYVLTPQDAVPEISVQRPLRPNGVAAPGAL